MLAEGVVLPYCPECEATQKPFGDHFMCCHKNGATERHNAMQDGMFELCGTHHIPVAREVTSECGRRPTDILFVGWSGGRDATVEFAVTHPLVAANHPINRARVLGRVNVEERRKVVENRVTCEKAGWGCHPFGVST